MLFEMLSFQQKITRRAKTWSQPDLQRGSSTISSTTRTPGSPFKILHSRAPWRFPAGERVGAGGGASRPGPGGERGAALHPGPSLALRASCLTALTCNCQPRASPVNDCACEEAQWGPLHAGLVSRVGAVLLDCLERLTLTRGA